MTVLLEYIYCVLTMMIVLLEYISIAVSTVTDIVKLRLIVILVLVPEDSWGDQLLNDKSRI